MLAGLARLRMMLESYLFLTLFSQLFYLQLWMGSVCECERRSVCESVKAREFVAFTGTGNCIVGV